MSQDIRRFAFAFVLGVIATAVIVPSASAEESDEDVTGQHHDTDVTISGLVSSMDEGGDDSFTVVAELEIGSHTISVTASGGVGFNSSCSSKSLPPRSVDNDGTNLIDHTYYWGLTLYGCESPGGTVTVSVSGVSDSQYVTVRPVPTPTPTESPTPTPTPTPTPSPYGEVRASRTSMDIGEIVTVEGYDLRPPDLAVFFSYTSHFRRGECVPSDPGGTQGNRI